MSRKQRNKLADYAVYLGVRLFAMFAEMFSAKTNYRTAKLIGELFFRLSKKHRERSIAHLRLSFPEWSESRYIDVARESMCNLVYLGLEFLFTPRLITPRRWRKHIRLENMEDTLELYMGKDRAIIFLTGHFGNWEIVGYTMACLGFPTTAVARHLDNLYLNNHILGLRQKRGLTILDKRGATGEIPEILDNNGSVGFIADQDAGRKGCFVDFFGRKASTYKSIALLAMHYEVPVVVGYGRRLSHDFNFEIGIARYIYPEEWKDKDDPKLYITQEYTKALEDLIRTAPEQYLWVHRRWKHRPDGTRSENDGIA